MENKLILFGDQHVTYNEPFFSVKKTYFNWVEDQPFNNDSNTAIFMGDFFHSNEPTPKEYELVHRFTEKLFFKEIYILSGNGIHEYNRSKDNWAIDPLSIHKHVTLIKEPYVLHVDNLDIVLLPWVPSKKFNDLTMKEWYENLEEYKTKEFDYILGHFNHKEFFGHIVDISYLKTKNIRMGHIHIPDAEGEYIGVDTITRYDEKGIDCNLNIIDMVTKEEKLYPIPRFFDYVFVKYGDEVKTETEYIKLDVLNAPSKEKAYQKYGSYFIRNITLEKDSKFNDSDDNKVLKFEKDDFITKFIEDKKISKGVEKKLRSVV